MSLRIGLESLAYFGVDDYKEGIRALRADGFDAFDYSEFCLTSSPLYAYSREKLKEYLRDLSKCAADEDVVISQMHGLWPVDDLSPEGLEASMSYFKREIEAAGWMNCPCVVIHPTLPFDWTPGHEEEVWATNVKRFTELARCAGENGTVVCVENLPAARLEIARAEGVKRLVREIDSPHLRVCFDTGHSDCCNESPAESVRLLGSDIACLHVHDNKKKGMDDHLIPYQGKIDWEPFLAALREIGYKGVFSLETMIFPRMPEPARGAFRKALAGLARQMADTLG